MILVTGGSGFIGSNFILGMLSHNSERVINLDKLTYASNQNSLRSLANDDRYIFKQGDIGNRILVSNILAEYKPRAIINFAAESHVDRSIEDSSSFIQTNIVGTHNLLECSRQYYDYLRGEAKARFRFLHISTDEVYGTLGSADKPFTEENQYKPNSPYSASKASSDHLVRAYNHTYGFPVLTTNCSNNYGAFQHPEKLIPLCIHRAINSREIPIYGDGSQIRDWLFVADHCRAIEKVLDKGRIGEVYNVGGWNEKTNLVVVNTICEILDELKPRGDGLSYKSQMVFVADRPGHDQRYAVDATKILSNMGWQPKETFESGLLKTIKWYLSNTDWVAGIYEKQMEEGLDD